MVASVFQVIQHTFYPIARFQNHVEFPIFACNNNKDAYVDATSMRRIANVKLLIANPSKVGKPCNYKLTVSFRLGTSELLVTASDDQTGKRIQASMEFVAD